MKVSHDGSESLQLFPWDETGILTLCHKWLHVSQGRVGSQGICWWLVFVVYIACMASVVLHFGWRLHQASPSLLLLLLYSLVVFNLTLIYSVLWESTEIVIMTRHTIINVSLILLWWQISSDSSDVFETAVVISAADTIGNGLQRLVLWTLDWSWSHLTVCNLLGFWSGTESGNISQRDCIELSLASWSHNSWSS